MRSFLSGILLLGSVFFISTSGFAQASTSRRSSVRTRHGTVKKASTPQQTTMTKGVFDTSAGKLTCELFPKQAPKTVENFIGLANGTKEWTSPATHQKKAGVPLYNGTIFHRVIPNFMIQGGDPAGTGSGDPGYSFADEFSPDLKFDRPGRLAMANSGPGTNGSQFFITEVPVPHLNGRHTIFGQCDQASVVLEKRIARMQRNMDNDRPFAPVVINKISIIQSAAASTPAHTGSATRSRKRRSARRQVTP